MVANMGYNWKESAYNNHSGKHNISSNDLNHKYMRALKWYHTTDILCYSDMRAMMILIEKHTNIDADTVEWMHHLAFSDKSNSDDNPMWDEARNVTHKEGYWLACKKDINALNMKHTWEGVDREDWMDFLPYTWDF